MPSVSTNGPPVKNLLDDGDGQPRYKALCLASGCDWSYEHEKGHFALARGKAHCSQTRHAVELRLDILDLFIDRIDPTVKSEATGQAPTVSRRVIAEVERELEMGCQQMMSPDPYSTDSCGAQAICVKCTACDEHCRCAEPLTLEELTTSENERRADR